MQTTILYNTNSPKIFFIHPFRSIKKTITLTFKRICVRFNENRYHNKNIHTKKYISTIFKIWHVFSVMRLDEVKLSCSVKYFSIWWTDVISICDLQIITTQWMHFFPYETKFFYYYYYYHHHVCYSGEFDAFRIRLVIFKRNRNRQTGFRASYYKNILYTFTKKPVRFLANVFKKDDAFEIWYLFNIIIKIYFTM